MPRAARVNSCWREASPSAIYTPKGASPSVCPGKGSRTVQTAARGSRTRIRGGAAGLLVGSSPASAPTPDLLADSLWGLGGSCPAQGLRPPSSMMEGLRGSSDYKVPWFLERLAAPEEGGGERVCVSVHIAAVSGQRCLLPLSAPPPLPRYTWGAVPYGLWG